MKFRSTILFVISFNVMLPAQETYSLTDCVNYCLNKHASLAVNENNILIAKEKGQQAISGFLPQINSSASFVDNFKLQTTILPAGVAGPTEKPVQFGTQFNTNIAFDFTQTVFDKSKLESIKANKPYQQLAQLQKELNQEEIAYNTAVAFYQVLILQQQQKSLNNNKSKYEELLKTLHKQVVLGVALQKDYDRILVSLNITTYQIEDAVSKENMALMSLKNAMGMSFDELLTIKDNQDYEEFAKPFEDNNFNDSDLLEIKLIDKQIALERINLDAKKATYLPVVTVFGKLGTQSLNNDFSKAFDSWSGYSYLGLSVNIPVFTGLKRKSLIDEAKLNLDTEIKNYQINKNNLALRYHNARTSVITAYSNFKSSKDNMILAESLADVTNFQYQKGVVPVADYLNDDNAYKNAQSNYLNSLYNLMISQLNYQKSKGSLIRFLNELK
jgi:outer membrane protein